MNCEQTRERMVDFLYAEELRPDPCFGFFQHLQNCAECKQQYLELVETREVMAQWNGSDEMLAEEERIVPLGRFSRPGSPWWWTMMPKVAAAVLIALGLLSIVRDLGFQDQRQVIVMEQELVKMLHDVTVVRQNEDRQVLGAMMLQVRDDLEQSRRRDLQQWYDYVQTWERTYQANLDENHRYMRSLELR